MKKVYLMPNHQQGKLFFTMIIDPRKIVDLIQVEEERHVQENQRPWSSKKVKQIAEYVALKSRENLSIGLIPNSPILSIKRPLEVKPEHVTLTTETGESCGLDLYSMMIPETPEEKQHYLRTIDIIDGQHRVLAFRKDLCDADFKDSTKFEMTFAVFTDLTKEEIKQLFVVTNDKQDKVQPNLLRLFKKALGLFDDDEEKVFDLTVKLNTETFSPLYGRIIIGANIISKGYKEQQISKILTKSGITEFVKQDMNGDTVKSLRVISNYIRAWEREYNVSYSAPGKDTLTKIAGLRYILFMFPYVWDTLKDQRKRATDEEIQEVISRLPIALNIPSIFDDPICKSAFKSETSTVAMAKDHGQILRSHWNGNSSFDPGQI